jgi:hypothetical protein
MLVQATIQSRKKPTKVQEYLYKQQANLEKTCKSRRIGVQNWLLNGKISSIPQNFRIPVNSCVGQFPGLPVTIGFGYTPSYVLGKD